MRIGEVHSKDDLLSALKTAVNDRLEKRRPYEAIWWNNIALVAGDHWLQFDPTRAVFAEKDPTWDTSEKKPRMVVNQALSVFRTELAKLTKNHPIVEVVANSDEAEDLAATKVGRSVLNAVEWKFKLPANRKEVLSWVIQTGIGAHYVGWDYLNSDSGEFEFTIDPETGEAAFSAERIREIKDQASENGDEPTVERYPLGDIDFKVYGPFQLLPSDFETNFTRIKDIITTEVADIDQVRDIYGRVADSLKQFDRVVHRGSRVFLQRGLHGAVPGRVGAGPGRRGRGRPRRQVPPRRRARGARRWRRRRAPGVR
jgi:hypothetical protein